MILEVLPDIDQIRLNFKPATLHIMNVIIGLLMFGVALELRVDQFKKVFVKPKAVILGLINQFFLMPALTFLLILIIKPTPSIALGMILVAACPGGNISNFITTLAKGNVELGVSLTAIGTILAVFMTPLNFAMWGGLYNATSPLLRPIHIDIFHMFQTVFILLGIPIILGMWFSKQFPQTTLKMLKPVKILAILVFVIFIIAAFHANFSYFLKYIHLIFIYVFIQNALVLALGYYSGKISGLQTKDNRTLAIETGIHNTGLGLALIFNPKIFPNDLGLGGMAFIAAWWGIWHIISGLMLAFYWRQARLNKNC